ncbi:putative membrane protein [Brevundimonas bullata]|uniref:Putative membrane protein n=1 Tax=Brevundimonas bullata TaxID=13160 RepID=A0A7W7N499_9CAUL|nr:phage holin family protein [Brevundimonas bullata]MBB4799385.1 putative membrane protein [Brevundimonas bullata]MBB6384543.1 putative membrane protein [Brevundimonas bullata]
MIGFIVQAVITALGLWLAAEVVPGVDFTSTGALVAAAVILGLVNAIVRPIMILLTLPLTIVTFGLFLLVVNAAMIGLTAWFLDGFVVNGLWAGIGAAIVTGVVSWIAGSVFGSGSRERA